MRALLPFVVTCTVAAACSSVPDVTYEDAGVDADGSTSGDAANDAATQPPVADAAPDVEVPGACGVLAPAETCCGTSICQNKDCAGTGGSLRCGQCSDKCKGKRCCPKGLDVQCVDYAKKCP